MLNLAQFAAEVHATAVEKGWYTPPQTSGERLANIHAEISEAFECWRKAGLFGLRIDASGKPHGFVVELADIVIRCLDWLHYRDLEIPESVDVETQDGLEVGEVIAIMHADTAIGTRSCLLDVIATCYGLAARFALDLDAALRQKAAFNVTRPYRHGGLRA